MDQSSSLTKSTKILLLLLNLAQCAPVGLHLLPTTWQNRSAYQHPPTFTSTDLNLDATSFTMGGFSSGGYMTANLFTMFSDSIDAAAINSGYGPCANTGWSCPNEPIVVYDTQGMKGKPVFFYSGVNDTVVYHNKTMKTSGWFEEQGVKIKKRWINDFAHIFPNSVLSNLELNPPYSCALKNYRTSAVHNCGYNLAGEIFTHILGIESMDRIDNYQDHGSLYAIDQRPFHSEGAKLADEGFLYIPTACQNKSCRFHVDFHGCTNTVVVYGDIYMRQLGYLEYAARNDIIMLFPQNNDTSTSPFLHCWISSIKSNRDHPQIQAIGDMIEAIFNRDLLYLGVKSEEKGVKSQEKKAAFSLFSNAMDSDLMKFSRAFYENLWINQ